MNLEQIQKLAKLSVMKPVVHKNLHGLDYSNPYYNFLYYLCDIMDPALVVELGTWKGDSTCRLAHGARNARVITVDIGPLPEAAGKIAKYKNIEQIVGPTESAQVLDAVPSGIDILFIDTMHTYDQAKMEYDFYAPKVRPGGVILFDDVSIDAGMDKFWKYVGGHGECVNIEDLHYTGFGIQIKK